MKSSLDLHLFRYVEMRQVGAGKGQVSAYPRQLESLIRLSEAHAKLRLSDRVEEIDVREAKRYEHNKMKNSSSMIILLDCTVKHSNRR